MPNLDIRGCPSLVLYTRVSSGDPTKSYLPGMNQLELEWRHPPYHPSAAAPMARLAIANALFPWRGTYRWHFAQY